MSLQILSIPGLALNYKNVNIKKLWGKYRIKEAIQVAHWQKKKSKREGAKITYISQQ